MFCLILYCTRLTKFCHQNQYHECYTTLQPVRKHKNAGSSWFIDVRNKIEFSYGILKICGFYFTKMTSDRCKYF